LTYSQSDRDGDNLCATGKAGAVASRNSNDLVLILLKNIHFSRKFSPWSSTADVGITAISIVKD